MTWAWLYLRLARDLTDSDPKPDSPWRVGPYGVRNCTGSKQWAYLGAPAFALISFISYNEVCDAHTEALREELICMIHR